MVRHYDWSYRNRITDAYTLINRARKNNPALQQTNNIRFTSSDNGNLLSYVKWDDARTNFIWTVVNFDQHNRQGGHVGVPHDLLGHNGFRVTDLLTGNQYWWNGNSNYVDIDPGQNPAHVFLVEFP
jgi:starch synthase (maltosyl-transferring)